jgi:hypothetical protein
VKLLAKMRATFKRLSESSKQRAIDRLDKKAKLLRARSEYEERKAQVQIDSDVFIGHP